MDKLVIAMYRLRPIQLKYGTRLAKQLNIILVIISMLFRDVGMSGEVSEMHWKQAMYS